MSADLSTQQDETKPVPMPDLKYQYEGRPQAMRTFIIESGAVTPPEVVAEQQAAAQAAAAKKQQAKPQQPPPATTTQPARPQPQTAPAAAQHPPA